MARLQWNSSVGSRYFEYGVDRGVLYVRSSESNYGVSWNGLINVSTSTKSDDPTEYYLDGVKYYLEPNPQDLKGSIEAFTYPPQFERCEGLADLSNGLGIDTQGQQTFGLSYRTMIGNDVDGPTHGYKIHLVYNALATPSDRENSTATEDPEAMTFSWDFSTTPILLVGRRPTSHLVLDSRKIKSDTLAHIESIIYGDIGTAPRLPTPEELITTMDDWMGFRIIPRTSGLADLDPTGADDLSGNSDEGIFTKSSGSRLTATTTPGIYRLG